MNMDRRTAIGAIGVSAIAAMVSPADQYQPVGYMDMSSPGVSDVDHVTVDGRRVDGVFVLDDINGWARYYGPNPEVDGDHIRQYYAEGAVRVHWKRRP